MDTAHSTANLIEETDQFRIELKRGIVYVTMKVEDLDYQTTDEGIRSRLKITQALSYPMISDIRAVKKFSRDARQRMAEDDAAKGVTVGAIVSNSRTHKIMYNFFIMLHKPPVPSRLFNDMKKAEEWIRSFGA